LGLSREMDYKEITDTDLEKMIKETKYKVADLLREKIRRQGYEVIDKGDETFIKKIK